MLRFVVPAYQDAPKAVHPRMGRLDDPAPSLLARWSCDRLCFLAPRPHRRGAPKRRQGSAHFLIVGPFVEAHALRWRLRWLRTLDAKAVKRGPHALHVMSVGTIQHQANGEAMPRSQQTALDPALGAIGGMWAGCFPPRVAPWSSRRPCSASASPCPAARPTVPLPCASVASRRPRRPTAETGRVRWTGDIPRSGARLPTGSPSGGRQTGHRHSGDQRHGAARPQRDADSQALEATVQGWPTA